MNIGQLVKELKKSFPSVTISRIRFLEKEGLIKPKRSSGGTRIFTEKDLKKLNKILDLQENQFYSLKAIKNNSSLLTKKDTKQIITNISTVDTFPFLETFISLLVNKTIKDPINISVSLTIIPIRK